MPNEKKPGRSSVRFASVSPPAISAIRLPNFNLNKCSNANSFGPIFNRVEHRPDPARPRVVEVLGSGAASPHQLAANKKHPASYFTPLSVSSFLFPLCVSVVLFVSHFSYILNLLLISSPLSASSLLLLRVRTLEASWRDPVMFFRVVFGGFGCPGQKTTVVHVLLALPPSTATPTNQQFPEKVWHPRPPKNLLANEHWRIPLLRPAVVGQRSLCCSGAEPKRFRLLRLQRPTQVAPVSPPENANGNAASPATEAPVTLALRAGAPACRLNSAPGGKGGTAISGE